MGSLQKQTLDFQKIIEYNSYIMTIEEQKSLAKEIRAQVTVLNNLLRTAQRGNLRIHMRHDAETKTGQMTQHSISIYDISVETKI